MKVNKLFEMVYNLFPDYKSRMEKADNLQKICQIEKDSQVKFPDSYFELYSILNEENLCLALGWSFVSIERVLFDLSVPPSSRPVICHNKKLIKPFNKSIKRILIADNYAGSKIYLDFDPNFDGNYGQVVALIENEILFNVAENFDSFIDFIYNEMYNKRVYFDEKNETLVFEIRENKPYHLLWYELSCKFKNVDRFVEIKDINHELKQSIFSLNEDYITPDFTSNDYGKIFKLELTGVFSNRVDIINSFPSLSYLLLDINEENILSVNYKNIDCLSINTELKDLVFMDSFSSTEILIIKCAPNLESLNFLKYFPNLQILSVENVSQSIDLSPILSSILLKSITINFGKFVEFKFIKQLTNIEYVDISNTNFDDLELLCNLKKLKYLNIENCPIVNVEALSNFTNPITIHCDVSVFIAYSKIVSHIKHKFDSLNGEMTDDEYLIWRNYCTN